MPAKTNRIFKAFLVVTIAVLFMTGFFVFEKKDVEAQNDAIAVRVLANPGHLSPLDWYKSKGFTGNPTPLTVDGYDAVQDGRTVYVNVANVTDDSFYTNIYLISYNQNAGADTVAIFNKILSNWKFNTNLTTQGSCFGGVDDSASCHTDADCPGAFTCNRGFCQQFCLVDKDCTEGICGSLKAKVTRDIKRLADISDLKLQIDSYNQRVGHYPLLGSGTYIPGDSISTWPSWSGEFAAELGIAPPVDPINKFLDGCGSSYDASLYDPLTCWDTKDKNFAGSIPGNLPYNGRVLVYSTDALGKNFTVCGEMESTLSVVDPNGDFSGDYCPGSNSSVPSPVISCGTLTGIAGQDFTGYVSATNPNKLPLTFTFSALPAGINIFDTSDPNQKMITSLTSDQVGKLSSVQKNALLAASSAVNACCQSATPPPTDLATAQRDETQCSAAATAVDAVGDAAFTADISNSLSSCRYTIETTLAQLANAARLATAQTAVAAACQTDVNSITTANASSVDAQCTAATQALNLVANSSDKTAAQTQLTTCCNAIEAKIAQVNQQAADDAVSVKVNTACALESKLSLINYTTVESDCAIASQALQTLSSGDANAAAMTSQLSGCCDGMADKVNQLYNSAAESAVEACEQAPLGTSDQINADVDLCNSALLAIAKATSNISSLNARVVAQESKFPQARHNLLPICSAGLFAPIDLSTISATGYSVAACQGYFTQIYNGLNSKRAASTMTLYQLSGNQVCDSCVCGVSTQNWGSADAYMSSPAGEALLPYSELSGGCLQNVQNDINIAGVPPLSIGGSWYVWDQNEGESGSCNPDMIYLFGCGYLKLPTYTAACATGATANPPTCRTSLLNDDQQKYQIAGSKDDFPVQIANAVTLSAGDYPFTVTVSDSKNLPVTQNCSIKITGNTFFVYPVADQRVDSGKTLNFSVFAYSNQKNYGGITFNFSDSAFKCNKTSVTTDGREECDVSFPSSDPQTYDLTVSATLGGVTTANQNFSVEVYNNPPVIQALNCAKTVRAGQPYMYTSETNNGCKIIATDPEGQNVTVMINGLPAGMFPQPGHLYGPLIYGTPNANTASPIPYNVTITAYDSYGLPSPTVTLPLSVNDYCGDGIVQSPNLESKGGHASNGYEDCDCGKYLNADGSINYVQCVQASGCTGVTDPLKAPQCVQGYKNNGLILGGVPTTTMSSFLWQYGCTKNCASANGGYCGDGVTQDGLLVARGAQEVVNATTNLLMKHSAVDYGEQCDFNVDNNCCKSCAWRTDNTETLTLTNDGWKTGTIAPTDIFSSLPVHENGLLSINLPGPGQTRGLVSGQVDMQEAGGTIVMFLSDLSYIGANSVTPDDFKNAIINSLDSFYNTSNVAGSVSDLYVGMIGFGGSGDKKTGPILSNTINDALGNDSGFLDLKDPTGQRASVGILENLVGKYGFHSDYDDTGNSGAVDAMAEAKTMMDTFIAEKGGTFKKYVIILSDGVMAAPGDTASAGSNPSYADALKGDGVTIYTMSWAYRGAGYLDMCGWSSASATDYANCAAAVNAKPKTLIPASNNYYYQVYTDKKTDLTLIDSIFSQVNASILADVPTNFSYTFAGIPDQTDGNLNTSAISCDPYGVGGCKIKLSGLNTAILNPTWVSGAGASFVFSNFRLTVYPPCE